jgi:hypothetical protein
VRTASGVDLQHEITPQPRGKPIDTLFVPGAFAVEDVIRDHDLIRWFVNDGTARDEIADELDDKQRLFRKYRKQSLYLLVPLVAPIAAWMRRSARLP